MPSYIYWFGKVLTWFRGRNGLGNCSGMELMVGINNDIIFTPLTGKGHPANGGFSVPIESVPDIIRTLKELTKKDKTKVDNKA